MAALTVLLSVAVGFVTNLLTEKWSWGLGIGIVVLVGGLVAVTVRATRRGTISGNRANVADGDTVLRARGGETEDNRLEGR
ncbi:hypothetical protein [Streptomyces antibioticus]|uniref:hypothetical protein n=1 Tax=Streptomyces antibioticus TaxID=1890 RepID=UPI00379E3BAF